MISIEIPDTNPKIEVDPSLRHNLNVFSFDLDRYVEGLDLAGVPRQVIDTLEVNFTDKADMLLGNGHVEYQDDRHIVQAVVNRGRSLQLDSRGRPFPNIYAALNHGLATSASTMADYVNKHPDAVKVRRNDIRSHELQSFVIGMSACAGSVAGTGIGEAIGQEPIIGAAIGLASGLLVGAAAVLTYDYNKHKKQTSIANKHHKAITARAEQFAESEEASRIFRGIVKIELAK